MSQLPAALAALASAADAEYAAGVRASGGSAKRCAALLSLGTLLRHGVPCCAALACHMRCANTMLLCIGKLSVFPPLPYLLQHGAAGALAAAVHRRAVRKRARGDGHGAARAGELYASLCFAAMP